MKMSLEWIGYTPQITWKIFWGLGNKDISKSNPRLSIKIFKPGSKPGMATNQLEAKQENPC